MAEPLEDGGGKEKLISSFVEIKAFVHQNTTPAKTECLNGHDNMLECFFILFCNIFILQIKLVLLKIYFL